MLVGDPETVDWAGLGAPAMNVTVPPASTIGVAIERVFTSALVDFSVQVEFPLESLAEQLETVFEVPEAVTVGVRLAIARLFLFLIATVIIETLVPFATTGPEPVIFELAITGA